MKTSTIIWVIAIVVILGGALWYFTSRSNIPAPVEQTNNNTQPTDQGTNTNTNTGADADPGIGDVSVSVNTQVSTSANVALTASGFSPASVTIKKGGTVTWTNQGGGNMWVGVDEHPTHTNYAGTTRTAHCPDTVGTAFDQCAPGSSYSFTFNKVGTWEYHNHMSAGQVGTVIVVE